MLKIEYRVLSEPAEVHWAGFRSDTYKLQQQGWEIAADEDVRYDTIRLLLRHRDMRLYALTDQTDYCFRQMLGNPTATMLKTQPRLVFNVVAASPHFQVQRIGSVDFEKFRQIDALPQIVHDVEIKSLEDFRIFATPLVRTEEIIVDPQTVSEMLGKIRAMQMPEQARLREKQRLAERRSDLVPADGAVPRQAFHAQIISIADRRAA